MEREIKFRAWHNELKKMLYPPLGIDSMLHVRDSEGQHVKIAIDGKEIPYPATMTWDGRQYINGKYQNLIWLQFTGLKDKNGEFIYDSDIVKWDDSSNGKYWRVAVVYWDENECIFCFKCVKNTLHELSTVEGHVFGANFMNRDKRSAAEELIKVGNIYENPELLIK